MSLGVTAAVFGFLVQLLLILATNGLLRESSSLKNMLLSALMGAVLLWMACLQKISPLTQLAWLVAGGAVAFWRGGQRLVRLAVFLLLYLAVIFLAQGQLWHLLLGVAGYMLLWLRQNRREETAQITLSHRGRTLCLTALRDTGNRLRDPVSGDGVLVVGPEVALSLLGLEKPALNKPLDTMAARPELGLRLIPCRTANQARGFMLGIRPERMELDGAPQRYILAFAPEPIGDGHTFEALMGGDL